MTSAEKKNKIKALKAKSTRLMNKQRATPLLADKIVIGRERAQVLKELKQVQRIMTLG